MARVALLTFVLVALLLSARAQLQDPGCPGLPTPCGGLARGVCFAANASAPPTCKCTAGWTGVDCTTPDCPGGCPVNAYCEPLLNPPACLCNASLNATGFDCAQVDLGCPGEPDCTDNVTNGICNTTSSQCMCMTGWTGPACDVPALCPLGPNNFTCTGNGDCVPNNVGFYYCRCYIGWLGEACEASVCDPVAGRNCSWPSGFCKTKYPPRCECTARRKGGQMCDKTDQTDDFDLSPIDKPAAFGIAISLAFLAFLILGVVVYLERTRFQCLTKQEREEDAAYARLEAARKLADTAPRKKVEEQLAADKSGSSVATAADASGSTVGSTAALVKNKQRVADDADGGL